uniref:Natural cytotoxicity triggering receptor 3 n=1 Tax=Erpetoichthys calabaricus TaxID=27687 RepID=A0A8C4RQV7_ERPCA
MVLCCVLLTGVCKELEVQQDPVINVTAGETAHLRCRFSHSGSSIIGSFRWYRGAPKGKEVNNDTHLTGIVRVDAETFSRDKDASIFILETLAQYQDTYYCEVDLLGEKSTGNGTRLIVRKPENKPNSGELNSTKSLEILANWLSSPSWPFYSIICVCVGQTDKKKESFYPWVPMIVQH